jgi:hypothetical protein
MQNRESLGSVQFDPSALSPDATLAFARQGRSIQVWHLDWELLPP